MTLAELFGPLAGEGRVTVRGGGDTEVGGLSIDSRKVRPGDLFAALEGHRGDGHSFLAPAVRAGAAALLVQRGRWEGEELEPAAVVETGDVRAVLGETADRFYGHPSGRLHLFGVTGTNGKTSVTWLLESIFREADRRTGVVGTIEYRWDGRREKAPCTTPEAVDLQSILRRMADDGVECVAMEVSSHSLAQQRVKGCRFRGAVFTNIGRDHLDFHPDLEAYFSAKAGLFRDFLPGISVVNGDDPWGRRILGWLPGSVSYGLSEGVDYGVRDLVSGPRGLAFSVEGRRGTVTLNSPLLGRHNVYNILAAAAAAMEYGLDGETVRRGVEAVGLIPGRFERVGTGEGPTVLVDYAHTPDALESALRGARELTGRALVLVFGCGGDRDRGKRPLMGQIAAGLADLTFLTSDNPRSEDPGQILREVEAGFRGRKGGGSLRVVPDRRRAIGQAVRAAGPGDVVLIAGKGHEDYQILSSGTVPFSDCDEARRALEEVAE